MAILSQGSQVYMLAESETPGTFEVVAIACATAFNPGGSPADQIETTCLEENDRSYMPGLRTPGQASLTVNFDPSEPSHVRMFELSQQNPSPTIKWALGWSDGTEAPGVGKGVASVTISAGGTGYTGTPTVTFSAPPAGGTTATGTVTVVGGVITGVVITNPGSGYVTAPTVTFSGAGTGAAGTAVLGESDFSLPTTRTWFAFEGYLSDVPFDFAQNSVVSSAVTIQRSGGAALIPKV